MPRRVTEKAMGSAPDWGALEGVIAGAVLPGSPEYESARKDLEHWAHAYYGANYDRLLRVKARYNPGDFFPFQQSLLHHVPGRDKPAT